MTIRAYATCAICQQKPAVRSALTCDQPRCRQVYRDHLQQRAICSICAVPLVGRVSPPTDPATVPTCSAARCQAKLAQVQRMLGGDKLVRCGICGRILLPGHAATGYCHDRDCLLLQHAERGRAEQAQVDQRYAALVAVAFDMRAREAAVQGRADAADYRPVVVPHQPAGLIERDPARVANLTSWLAAIAESVPRPSVPSEQVVSEPDPPNEEVDTREIQIVHTGCRLCRGLCCRNGVDSAYLDTPTFARAWAAAPHRSREELQADYLAFVPQRSVENSCVYHGEFGCTLPRGMRAQICNQFLCGGLKDGLRQLRHDGATRLYLISAVEQEFGAGEFLDLRNP